MAYLVNQEFASVLLEEDIEDGLPKSSPVNSVGLAVCMVAFGYCHQNAKQEVALLMRRLKDRHRRFAIYLRRRGSTNTMTSSLPQGGNVPYNPIHLTRRSLTRAKAKLRSFALLKRKVAQALTIRTGDSERMEEFQDYVRSRCTIVDIFGENRWATFRSLKSESRACNELHNILRCKRDENRQEQARFAREDFDELLRKYRYSERKRKWEVSNAFLVNACSQKWEYIARELAPNVVHVIGDMRLKMMTGVTSFTLADIIEEDVTYFRLLAEHRWF